jgi:hypothetical protein
MFREPLEHPSRGDAIPVADPLERPRDRGFDRPLSGGIDASPPRRQPQDRPSPIAGVVRASQEPLPDQPLKYTGQRAGMHVQHGRQIASRHAGKQTDDTKDQPLGTCDADVSRHPFGDALQSMHNRPEQPHELQHIREVIQFILVQTAVRMRHIILNSNYLMLPWTA